MDISRNHASGLIRSLRQAQKIRAHCLPGDIRPCWVRISTPPACEAATGAYEARRWLWFYLDLWHRAMRAFCGPDGYPAASCGMPTRTRITSFEDLEEENDRRMVELFDARIDELPDIERAAIGYHFGLTHCWPFADHPQDRLDDATDTLIAALRKYTSVPGS
jgi:hypothetical protein